MSRAGHSHLKRLIVISAPSGAGKTTLCSRLLRDFPVLKLSISSTTRAPRGSEQDGREYFFLSREEFERQIEADRFAEYARVHDNYYGTSKDTIDRAFAEGKSVLLDIDVQGAESLRHAYPGQTFSVFIAPPDLETLEARLRARGTENEETIRKRMRNADDEMKAARHFDATVVNRDLEQAYTELREIIELQLRPGGGGRDG